MFCMQKNKNKYPAYVSKHNPNRGKQAIVLINLNGERREAKSKGG